MPAPGTVLEPSLTEVTFLKQSLLHSIRHDGRGLLQSRPVSIRFGEQLGWVEVCLGPPHASSSQTTSHTTRVVVSTHATAVVPRADRPFEGFLDLRAEVQPMAGSGFERGRTNDEEIAFERNLDRAIRRGEVVDREALCIVAGYRVWNVCLTVHLLSNQGAALDAAVLACICALRHFRRPDASIRSHAQAPITSAPARRNKRTMGPMGKVGGQDEGPRPRVILHDLQERAPIPLALHHHPLSVSFAIFDPAHMASSYISGVGATASGTGGTAMADDDDDAHVLILADPSPLESLLCTSKLLVVANVQGEVCVLDKSGGRPLSEAVVNRVIGLARLRVKSLNETMDKALQADAAERVIDVL